MYLDNSSIIKYYNARTYSKRLYLPVIKETIWYMDCYNNYNYIIYSIAWRSF